MTIPFMQVQLIVIVFLFFITNTTYLCNNNITFILNYDYFDC
jgi:hypothetical protein